MLATQARAGLPGEARAGLAALDEEEARSGEVRNADAVICLAEDEPAAALSAVASVLDGTTPVIGYTTVIEAHLLAGLAYRQLGDQRAANQAAEHALTSPRRDRVVLPFVMTGSAGCWRRCRGMRPRTPRCSPTSSTSCTARPWGPKTSPHRRRRKISARASSGYFGIFRRTCRRSEIAGELSVSQHTVSAHIRSIYAKLGVADRSAAVRRARELRLLAAVRS